jgi:hypothetical protein
MKRNIFSKLVLVLTLAILASCSSRKVLVTRKTDSTAVAEVNKENSITAKLNAIKARQLNYNTFTGKAKTKLDIDGKSNDVTMNIRIQHGKKIWVSITAIVGIEVARAVITPDSIMVINRLQGVYIKKPFSYVYTYTSKQVNFNTLEALLVGNAIPELLNDKVEIQASGTNTILSGSLQRLVYRLVIGSDLKVSQTNLSEGATAQALQATNSNFIQTDNRIMPSQVNIMSTVKNKKIEANLTYSKANFDQVLEFPFSIPDRYTPAD